MKVLAAIKTIKDSNTGMRAITNSGHAQLYFCELTIAFITTGDSNISKSVIIVLVRPRPVKLKLCKNSLLARTCGIAHLRRKEK